MADGHVCMVFLTANLCRRAQPNADRIIPRQASLSYVKKMADRKPWEIQWAVFLHDSCLHSCLSSCPDFSVLDFHLDSKPNKHFLSQVTFDCDIYKIKLIQPVYKYEINTVHLQTRELWQPGTPK